MLSTTERNLAIDLLSHARCDRWKQIEDMLPNIQKRAILTYCDKSAPEPLLVVAARAGQDILVKKLVEEHQDIINCRGREKRTALFVYANNRCDIEMVKWLLQRGANPRIQEMASRRKFAQYDEDNEAHEYYPYTLYTSLLKRLFQLVLEGSKPEYSSKNYLSSLPRNYHTENYMDDPQGEDDLMRFQVGCQKRKEIILFLLQQQGRCAIVRSEVKLLKQYVTMLCEADITKAFEAALSGGRNETKYSLRDAKHALRHGSWEILETSLRESIRLTGWSRAQRNFLHLCASSVAGTRLWSGDGPIPEMPLSTCRMLVPLLTRDLKSGFAGHLHNFKGFLFGGLLDPQRIHYLIPFLAKGAFLYQSNMWIRFWDHGHNTATDRSCKPRREKISILQYAAMNNDQDLCRAVVENAPRLGYLLSYRGKSERLAHQLVENNESLRVYLEDAYNQHCRGIAPPMNNDNKNL